MNKGNNRKKNASVHFSSSNSTLHHTTSEEQVDIQSSFIRQQTAFNTEHEAQVNDAKMDYYGTMLATASSDKSVRIFAVDCRTGGYHKLAVLTGYDGPVIQLAWSHPNFGSLLASACYDGRIIIWKQANNDSDNSDSKSKWNALFDKCLHKSSVNSVAWAAPEFGALLAAASSDESVSILSANEHEFWTSEVIPKVHQLGCQSVSWSVSAKRFASGGNDYNVKIWSCSEENKWILESTLEAHTDWVFNVEWSPVANILVSAGRDGRILLWTRKEEPTIPAWNHSINQSLYHTNIDISYSESEDWSLQVLQTLERGSTPYVSWDPMGTFLCVSGDQKEISIWKQDNEQEWTLVAKPRIVSGKLSESFGVLIL